MTPGFHHVELWIVDDVAAGGWAWLLERLGFVRERSWADGESWAELGGRRVVGGGRLVPHPHEVADSVVG